MANDWKVVALDETYDASFSDGSASHSTRILDETSFRSTVTGTSQLGEPIPPVNTSGTVNVNEWHIEKDGAWTQTEEYVSTDSSTETTSRIEQSGTWNFLGKNKGDGFRKNERVIFNVLAKRVKTVQKNQGAVISDDSTNETYLTGERTIIYTIKESGNKELKLELEAERVLKQDVNVTSTLRKLNIVLKER